MSINRSNPVQVAAYSTNYSQNPKFIGRSWTKISIGPSHVLGIKSDNTLWSWGLNSDGQLGDNSTISRSSPIQLGNFGWTDINVGNNFSIALRIDNLLFSWGVNSAGQLGISTNPGNASRSSPVQIGSSSWTQISAGATHVAAIRSDKKLFAWGFNSLGQLGSGDLIFRSSPVQVGTSNWISVSAGLTHTSGITTDNKLFTWGDNTAGQLGYDIPAGTYFSWTTVAGNSDHTIAIRNDGLLFGWGLNNYGQLGLNDIIWRSSPTQIGTNSWRTASVNGLAGGLIATLAIRNDGTLWAWGYNGYGQLAQGDFVNRSNPVQISSRIASDWIWSSISAGKSHMLAIRSNGRLYGWGNGTYGQLNTSTTPTYLAAPILLDAAFPKDESSNNIQFIRSNIATMVDVSPFITGDYDIAAYGGSLYFGQQNDYLTFQNNGAMTIGVSDFTLECWVYPLNYVSSTYQAGILDTRGSPVSQNWFFTLNNTTGNVYYGSLYTTVYYVGAIPIPLYAWTHVAFVRNSGTLSLYINGVLDKSWAHTTSMIPYGSIHYIGTLSDGANYGFNGYISNLRLVNTTAVYTANFTPSRIPLTAIPGTTLLVGKAVTNTNSWTFVAAGDISSSAIRIDGSLWSWGNNSSGELGDTTVISRSSAVQIGTSSWTNVYAYGSNWIHAIDASNRLFAWGNNGVGRLGNNTTANTSSPVQIGNKSWKFLAGYSTTGQTFGLQTDNSLWVWGQKSTLLNFEYNNASLTYSWTQISAGPSHTAAIRSDNKLYMWGFNNSGQLGDATTVNKSSPVVINAFTDIINGNTGEYWNNVSVNGLRTVAVRTDGSLWSWGNNSNGILGDGTTINRSYPVQIGRDIVTTTTVTNVNAYSSVFNYAYTSLAVIDTFQLPTNAAYALGTGDYTIEAWIYPTARGVQSQIIGPHSWGVSADYMLALNTAGALYWQIGSTTTGSITSTIIVPLNNWTHVAVARTNGVGYLYINGVVSGGTAQTNNITNTLATAIGGTTNSNTNAIFYGYISNVRIVKGQSIYFPASIIAPSLTPLTNSVVNTSLIAFNNNTTPFQDSSSQNFRMVLNSATTSAPAPSTLIPGNFNYYSTYFNGTTDLVIVNTPTGFAFGASDFTVEEWFYPTIAQPIGSYYFSTGALGDDFNIAQQASSLKLTVGSISLPTIIVSSIDITLASWNHIAVSRSGTTLRLFINGQLAGSATDSTVYTATSGVLIGKNPNSAIYNTGYFSNIRVLTGTALYTSAFTLPNSPLIVIANTSLLVLTAPNQLVDYSVNNFSITTSGSPTRNLLNPYGYNSVYFNGSTDYLTIPSSPNLAFGTGDFTIEMWCYLTATGSGDGAFWEARNSGATSTGFIFNSRAVTGGYKLNIFTDGAANIGATTILYNTWAHIAVCRSSGSIRLFVNGIVDLTVSKANNFSETPAITIGSSALYPSSNITGYISNLRIVKGTALYTTAFTPSTTPLTAITGTSLLICTSNTSLNPFKDLSTNNFSLTFSTSVKNYTFSYLDPFITLASTSTYFNGSSSYLTLPSTAGDLGTGDWTIEFWFNSASTNSSNYATVLSKGITGTATTGAWSFGVKFNTTPAVWFAYNNGGFVDVSTAYTTLDSSWHHIAATRTGTSLRLYIDGTLLNTATLPSNFNFGAGLADTLNIGFNSRNSAYLGGYLSNLRIVKGSLFYTGTYITVPTTFPLTNITGTTVLLFTTNKQLTDASSTPFAVTPVNSPRITSVTPASLTFDSVFFSGTQYITTPASSITGIIGTNGLSNLSVFSIECWIYHIARHTTNEGYIIGDMLPTGGTNTWSWGPNQNGNLAFYWYTGAAPVTVFGSSFIPLNTWTHIALTINASSIFMHVNGKRETLTGTTTIGSVAATTGALAMGYCNSTIATSFTGYVSNFRIVKSALYTVSATPSTARLTASSVPNTSLLLFATNTPLIDASSTPYTITATSGLRPATLSPYTSITYNSMYFNGTSDYITIADNAAFQFGTGNFTMEAWVYLINPPNATNRRIISYQNTGTSTAVYIGIDTSNKFIGFLRDSAGAGGTTYTAITIPVPGVWYHVALTRSNSISYLYINGVAESVTTGQTQSLGGGAFTIGAFSATPAEFWSGHISNARIIKGTAVYPILPLFTPSLAPLTTTTIGSYGTGAATLLIPNTGSVVMLTCQNLTPVDNSSIAATVTVNGLPLSGQTVTPFTTSITTANTRVSWNKISAGLSHTLAIDSANRLYTWGNNTYQQLGTGSTILSRSAPVQLGTNSWSQISSLGNHSLAISSTNKLFAWGDNSIYQSGENISSLSSLTTLYTNRLGTFAVKRNDGTIWIWGANTNGMLGLGDSIARSSPVQIGTSSWSMVAIGSSHIIAIRGDGTLWSWGSNSVGQLGEVLTTPIAGNRSSPVQIGTSSWIFVAADTDTSFAIRTDGGLFAWGQNTIAGHLGLGDTINRSSPVQIGTSSWTQISVNAQSGGGSVLAIRSDNTLFAWGLNSSGQLGLSDALNRSSPVQVGIYSNWTSVSAGRSHTLALNSNGMLYAWGLNTSGQLGSLTVTNQSSPLVIAATQFSVDTVANAPFTWSGAPQMVEVNPFVPMFSTYNLATYGGSGYFNGSTWIGTTNNSNFDLSESGSFTIEAWIYPTVAGTNRGIAGARGNGVASGWCIYVHTSNTFYMGSIIEGNGYLDRQLHTATIVTNNWTHVALIKDSTGYIAYVNGIPGNKIPLTGGLNYQSGQPLTTGALASAGESPFTGYISNFRIARTQVYLPPVNSTFFNGSTDSLTIPGSPNLEFGSGNFTVEFWTYWVGGTIFFCWSVDYHIGMVGNYGGAGSDKLGLYASSNGSSWDIFTADGAGNGITSAACPKNTWAHIALVRNGSDWGIYINGLRSWTGTSSATIVTRSTDTFRIAGPWGNTGPVLFSGCISNFRIVKGTALYTSNFTTSFAPLTAVANTSLLVLNGSNSQLTDQSIYKFPVTTVGTPTSAPNSPFYGLDTSIASTLFNGSTNYLTATIPAIGNNMFTFEFWYYLFSAPAGTPAIFSVGAAEGANTTMLLWMNTTRTITLYSTSQLIITTETVPLNTWTHIAIVRNSIGNATVYINGVASTSVAMSRNLTNTSLQINKGWGSAATGQTCYISNFRFLNNIALYTSNFTPSTTPLTAITGTSLLTLSGTSQTTDISGNVTLTVVGTPLAQYLSPFIRSSAFTISTTPLTNVPGTKIISLSYMPPLGWSKISAGDQSSYATQNDGTLYAWGLNTTGQFGDNTLTNRSSPVQIGTSSWTAIAAGAGAAGITNGGNALSSIYLWGPSTNFSAPFGSTINRSSPVQIDSGLSLTRLVSSPIQIGTSNYSVISAGLSSSFAITTDNKLFMWGDNSSLQSGNVTPTTLLSGSVSNGNGLSLIRASDNALMLWGYNDAGQLGLGDLISRSNPVQINTKNGTVIPFKKVAGAKVIASGFTLAVKTDGTLWAWGNNNAGQLGINTTINRSSPTQVGTDTNWSDIALGISHTIAIKTDGTLWGWGNNTYGQAGTLSWSKISSGNSHTLALRSDNSLWAWGLNSSGQLGDGSTVNKSSPVFVSNAFLWRDIAAGTNMSAGISINGLLYTWGNNTNGVLGLGDILNKNTPHLVSSVLSFTQVSVKNSHTLAISSNKLLFGFGANNSGQLGLGDTIDRSSPVQIGSNSWISVAAGYDHTLALRSDYTLYAWGLNNYGQIGTSDTINRSSPVQVSTSSWTTIDSGFNHSLAIRTDGKLFAWGNNSGAQLGLGNYISYSSPVQVGTSNWTKIYATNYYSLAISAINSLFGWGNLTVLNKNTVTPAFSWSSVNTGVGIHSDSTLWTWGINTNGQLGINDTVSRSSPIAVATNSWLSSVSTLQNTYAIKNDGTLWAWGRNNIGQLGLGDTIDRSSPVQIGSSSWSSVSASLYGTHVLGITSTGALFAWGDNRYNQLGQNEFIVAPRSSPVQVGSSSWTKVSAGGQHSLAIRNDGALFGWGRNGQGQVTQNIALSWASVSSGVSYNIALRNDGALFGWGLNNKGQLGLSDTVNRSFPVQITTQANSLYYSYYFGGSGGPHFSIADNAAFAIVNNSASVEMWFYAFRTDSPSYQSLNGQNVGTSSSLRIGISPNGTVRYSTTADTNHAFLPIANNTWYHALVTYDGINQVARFFVDGLLIHCQTDVTSIPDIAGVYEFGGEDANSFNGYISNFRFCNGSIPTQYITTSAIVGQKIFTPSTTPLTTTSQGATAADVKILTCQSNTIKDNSNNNWPITFVRGPLIPVTENPFTTNISNYSWTQVSAGTSHVMAIRNDGVIWSWGSNSSGQLGQSDTVDRSAPVQLGTSRWTAISSGVDSTFAIRIDGGLFTWGNNSTGALGQGSTVNLSSPVQVGNSSWTQISVTQHALAIATNNTLYAWGLNTAGQLGDNTTVNKSSPIQVSTSNWTRVSSGTSFSIALRTDSGLFTWGLNTSGQLGSGLTTARSSPVQVGTSSWTVIAAGSTWAGALRAVDGALFTWGAGTVGELASGATTARSSPVQVGTSSWSMLSASTGTGGIATTTTNLVYTWGSAVSGQLGDNTTVNKSAPSGIAHSWTMQAAPGREVIASPTQITTSSYTQISAGDMHSMAITSGNFQLFAWGQNDFGQIGNATSGATTNRSSPTQIGTSSWSQISSGFITSAAVDVLGRLYTWGSGVIYGQQGANATANRNAPTQVGASSWIQVSAGYFSMSGLDIDRNLFTWGLNNQGQLGLNDTVNRSSPVQVGTNSTTLVTTPTKIITDSVTSTPATYFNGSTDYYTIKANDNSQLSLSYNDFTIEVWVFPTSTSYRYSAIFDFRVPSTAHTYCLDLQSGLGAYRVEFYTGTSYLTSDIPVYANVWTHIAVTRAANVLRIFINGVLDTAWNNINTLIYCNNSAPLLGTLGDGGADGFIGYINNLRIVKNQALYTDAFVPNTTSLPALVTGTSLLTLSGTNQSSDLTTTFTLTTNGTPTVSTNSPFNIAPASIYFNSVSGDNIFYPNLVALPTTTTPFTIECWVNMTTAAGTVIVSSNHTTGNYVSFVIGTGNSMGGQQSQQLNFGYYNGGAWVGIVSTQTINLNTWYHVAGVYTGTQATLYVNAQVFATGPITWVAGTTANQLAGFYIGRRWDTSGAPYFNGYIRDFRFVIGTALYTTAGFALPTAPLTAITGTVLLLPLDTIVYTNAVDNVTCIGNVSPSLSGWSPLITTVGSTYFNGTTSYYTIANNAALTSMNGSLFTAEAWIYSIATTTGAIFGCSTSTTAGYLVMQVSGVLTAYLNGGAVTITGPNIQQNVWVHVALVYNGTTTTLFANGGVVGTPAATSPANVATNPFVIGGITTTTGWASNQYFTGFISNVRVVKGYALYSKAVSFVPGTTALTKTSLGAFATNVALLTFQDDIPVDKSNYNNIFNTFGNPITSNSITNLISAGDSFASLVESYGRLFQTGVNSVGQIADITTANKLILTPVGFNTLGETIARSSPVQISSGSWSQIAAGGSFSAALKSDGTLWTWGDNDYGQLGQGNFVTYAGTTRTFSMIQVGTSSWSQISAGLSYMIAIDTTYKLYAWGRNDFGLLGVNDIINRSSPVQIGSSSWSQISAGVFTPLALDVNNVLYAWGNNNFGQLGDSTTINKSSPVQISTARIYNQYNTPIVSILTLQNNTLIDNSIFKAPITNTTGNAVVSSTIIPFANTFSYYFNGSTCVGTTNNPQFDFSSLASFTMEAWIYPTVTNVSLGIFSGRAASVASGWCVYVDTNNKLTLVSIIVGNVWTSRILNSTIIRPNTWTHVAFVKDPTGYTCYANGVANIKIVLTTGTDYQPGNRFTIGANASNGGESLFTGYISNVRVVKNMILYTDNFIVPTSALQLTQNASTNISQIPQTPAINWNSISGGISHSLATTSDGRIYTWGENTYGQLADLTTTSRSTPLAVGSIYSIPVQERYYTSPIQILPSYSWQSVSTGDGHTLAITTNNTLWTWGQNIIGQLGENVTVSRSSPIQLNTTVYLSVASVTAGLSNSFVIRNYDGLLFGWGRNDFGQLGLNDITNRSSPVQVFSGTQASLLIPTRVYRFIGKSVTQVQAGSAASVIDSTGTLFTWGEGAYGQVGDLTINDLLYPVRVGGVIGRGFVMDPTVVGTSSWSVASAGTSHTLGITSTGSLFGWGKTPGNGDTINRSSPTQIGSNSWLLVNAGVDLSQAIDKTRTLFVWGKNSNFNFGTGNILVDQVVTSPIAIDTLMVVNTTSTIDTNSTGGGFIKNI